MTRDATSLGPANDSPPEVQIEIRAAELAVTYGEPRFWDASADEWAGWRTWLGERETLSTTEAAGYLANAIVQHSEDEYAEAEAMLRTGWSP